jgi:hypothetical protein
MTTVLKNGGTQRPPGGLSKGLLFSRVPLKSKLCAKVGVVVVTSARADDAARQRVRRAAKYRMLMLLIRLHPVAAARRASPDLHVTSHKADLMIW